MLQDKSDEKKVWSLIANDNVLMKIPILTVNQPRSEQVDVLHKVTFFMISHFQFHCIRIET